MSRRDALPGWGLVVTCEHAGHAVPPALRAVFRGHGLVLRSHRGWDIGALGVARRLSEVLGAPLFAQTVSRLVVEMNRSLDSPTLFSEFTRPLSGRVRDGLIDEHWRPFRAAARAAIDRAISRHGRALHLSVHSFTPVWKGRERGVEIGLLDDPRRRVERAVTAAWRGEVLGRCPAGWRIYLNRPYAGWTDGHTAALRAALPGSEYAGIEIEVNNRLIRRTSDQRRVADLLAGALSGLPSPPAKGSKREQTRSGEGSRP